MVSNIVKHIVAVIISLGAGCLFYGVEISILQAISDVLDNITVGNMSVLMIGFSVVVSVYSYILIRVNMGGMDNKEK